MRNVARESDANLQALFTNTSAKSGLSPAVIEKDFWVCWLLDYLFDRSPWKKQLAFKGGTSLSYVLKAEVLPRGLLRSISRFLLTPPIFIRKFSSRRTHWFTLSRQNGRFGRK